MQGLRIEGEHVPRAPEVEEVSAAHKDAHDEGRAEHGRYYCRRCADGGAVVQAFERHSMGCYAGMLCDACWRLDGKNHDRHFDPADAGETLEPETP